MTKQVRDRSEILEKPRKKPWKWSMCANHKCFRNVKDRDICWVWDKHCLGLDAQLDCIVCVEADASLLWWDSGKLRSCGSKLEDTPVYALTVRKKKTSYQCKQGYCCLKAFHMACRWNQSGQRQPHPDSSRTTTPCPYLKGWGEALPPYLGWGVAW